MIAEPVDTIRNFPRCGHYLDEARCTRRIHGGDHEVVQGDEVIVWPANEPDREPVMEVEEWSDIEDVPVGLIVKGRAMIWKWDGTHPYRRTGGGWTRESCDYANRWWPFTPAPAEPAEEETKAEEFCCHPDCRNTNWGGRNRKHYRDSDCPPSKEVRLQNALELGRRISEAHKAASSPVVPAPTETGPWETLAEIPASVTCIKDRGHWIWTRIDADEWRCGALTQPSCLAPFVAAEEGRA